MSLLRSIAVVILVLVMQYTALAATYRAPVTLAVNQDTWVRDGSNKAEGTDTLLRIHNAQPSAVVLGVDTSAVQAAAAGDQIHTAYLELYVHTSDAWGARGRHLDLHALDQTWDETATWNCPMDEDGQQLNKVTCVTGWDLQTGAIDTNRVERILARTAVTGWTRIDISSDIARWQNAGNTISWLLLKRYVGKRGLWEIDSRESAFTPRLVLGFEPAAEVLNHDIALIRDAYVDQSVPYSTFVGSNVLELGKKGRYSVLLDPDWSTVAAAGQERPIHKVFLALEVETGTQMGAAATMYVHGVAEPWVNVSWACTDIDFVGGCAVSWLNNVPGYHPTAITSVVIPASPGVPESLFIDITQAALAEINGAGNLEHGLYLRMAETVAGAQLSLFSGISDFPTRLIVEYEPTPPYLASAFITVAEGGTVLVDDPESPYNGIRLNVPAGSLVTDTIVYLNAVDDNLDWNLAPYGWPVTDYPVEVGVETGGFTAPVELELSYNLAYVYPFEAENVSTFASTEAVTNATWDVQAKISQDLDKNTLVSSLTTPGFFWVGVPLHGRPHPDIRFGAPALTYYTQPAAYLEDFNDGWFNPNIWFHVDQSHVGGVVEEVGGNLVLDTGINVPQNQYDLVVQQQVYAYVPEHSETYAITVTGHFDEVSEGRYTFGLNFFGYAAGNIDYVETGSYELQVQEGNEVRSSLTTLNSGSSSVSVSQIPFLSLKELDLTFHLSYDGATGLMRASVEPFGLEVTVVNAVQQAPRYLALVNMAGAAGQHGYRRSRFLVDEVNLVFTESGQYLVDVTPFKFQGTLYSLEVTPFVLFDERALQVDTSQGFPPQLGLTQNFTPIVADGTAVSMYPIGDFNVALLDLGPSDMYTVITQWEYSDFTNIGIVPDAILPSVFRARRYGVDFETNLVPNNSPVIVADVPDLWLGGTAVVLSAEDSVDLDSTPGTNDDIVGFAWYLDVDADGLVSSTDIALQGLADSHTDRYASISLDPALVAQGNQHILAVASDRFGAVSTQGHWVYNRHVNAAPIAFASPVTEPYYGVTAPTGLHLVLDGSASLDSDSAYANDDIVEFDWFFDSNDDGLIDVGDVHLDEAGMYYAPGRSARDERITIRADWMSEGTILLRVRDRYGAEDVASIPLVKLDLVLAAQQIESRLLALYGGPLDYETYEVELGWASDLVLRVSSGDANASITTLDLLQPILSVPAVCPLASVCYNSYQHLLDLLPQFRQSGWDFGGSLADAQNYLSVADGSVTVQGQWVNSELIEDGWIDVRQGYSWDNGPVANYDLPVASQPVTSAVFLIDDGQGNAGNSHTLFVRWQTWGGVQYEQLRSVVWQTVDRQPPVIAILSPPDGYNTTSQQLPLIGQVTDNNYIQEVSLHLQGPNSFVEGGIVDRLEADGSFYVPIGLDPFLLEYPAVHTATVVAVDAHGNESSRSITLGFWDTLPPPAPVTATIHTPADGLSVRTGLVYVSTAAYTDSQDPLQSHSLYINNVDRSSELLDLQTGLSGWLWLGAEGTYDLQYSLTTSGGTTAQAFSTAYVDQTPPTIGQLYPFAQAVSDPYVPLQVTVVDSVSSIDQLEFEFQDPGYVCSQGSCQTVVVSADQAELQHGAVLYDGQYTWSVAVFDFAGNVTYSAPVPFTVDTIAPVFSLQITAPSFARGNQLFVGQLIDELTIGASDVGAGIASISIADNQGGLYGPDQTDYAVYPISQLPVDVQVDVLDLAGNAAATAVSIVLDQTGPTVTSAIVGPQFDDGSKLWTSEEHSRIGLWASDVGAGVQRILYSNSNNMYVAPLKTYGQPFRNYGSNRQKFISAQATDLLGNTGNLLEYTVWVDNSEPTLYPVFAGQYGNAPSFGGETSYVVGLQTTASLYTEDSGSGLASAGYQIETYQGTVVQSGGDVLIPFSGLLPGLYRLRLSASDNVQNTAAYSVLLYVDSAGPDVSIQVQGPQYAVGTTLYVANSTVFDILADDAGGAVTESWYRIDGGSWQTGIQLQAAEAGVDGTYLLEAIAFDDAANISAPASLVFVLDNATPVVEFAVSGTYYTSGADTWLGPDSSVTAAVTDAAAGVTRAVWSWVGAATAATTAAGVLVFDTLPVNSGHVTASVLAWDGLQHSTAATAGWLADLAAPIMTTAITPVASRNGVLYVSPGSVLSAAVTDADSGLAGWYASTGTAYGSAMAATESVLAFAGYSADDLVVRAYAADRVGNQTLTVTAAVTVDGIAPEVQFFASGTTFHDQLGQLWALDGTSVDVMVTDAGVGGSVAAYQYSGTDAAMPLVLSGAGLHSIDYQVVDELGNQATGQGAVRIDVAAPVFTLIDLTDGDVIRQPNVNVGFWATDVLPVQAFVNGQAATKYQDGSYWKEIALSPGDNPIEVTATDALGQTSTLTFSVYRSVLNLQVSTPEQNTVTTATDILVSGYVDPATGPAVLVSGVQVNLDAAGAFSTTVPLQSEATNNIVVSASYQGELSTETRRVYQGIDAPADTDPAIITVLQPGQGAAVAGPQVDVIFSANEPITGTVNGLTFAQLPDGRYLATITLAEGPRVIVIHGYDTAGNLTERQIDVLADNAAPLLTVYAPAPGAVTQASPVAVTGRIQDITLGYLTINGQDVLLSGDHFSHSVALVPGTNYLQFQAGDAVGYQVAVSQSITLDAAVPQVAWISPEAGADVTEYTWVELHIESAEPLARVSVDNQDLYDIGNNRYANYIYLPVGSHTMTAQAINSQGGFARVERNVLVRDPANEALYVANVTPATGAQDISNIDWVELHFSAPVSMPSLIENLRMSASNGVTLNVGFGLLGDRVVTIGSYDGWPEGEEVVITVPAGVESTFSQPTDREFTTYFAVRPAMTIAQVVVFDENMVPVEQGTVTVKDNRGNVLGEADITLAGNARVELGHGFEGEVKVHFHGRNNFDRIVKKLVRAGERNSIYIVTPDSTTDQGRFIIKPGQWVSARGSQLEFKFDDYPIDENGQPVHVIQVRELPRNGWPNVESDSFAVSRAWQVFPSKLSTIDGSNLSLRIPGEPLDGNSELLLLGAQAIDLKSVVGVAEYSDGKYLFDLGNGNLGQTLGFAVKSRDSELEDNHYSKTAKVSVASKPLSIRGTNSKTSGARILTANSFSFGLGDINSFAGDILSDFNTYQFFVEKPCNPEHYVFSTYAKVINGVEQTFSKFDYVRYDPAVTTVFEGMLDLSRYGFKDVGPACPPMEGIKIETWVNDVNGTTTDRNGIGSLVIPTLLDNGISATVLLPLPTYELPLFRFPLGLIPFDDNTTRLEAIPTTNQHLGLSVPVQVVASTYNVDTTFDTVVAGLEEKIETTSFHSTGEIAQINPTEFYAFESYVFGEAGMLDYQVFRKGFGESHNQSLYRDALSELIIPLHGTDSFFNGLKDSLIVEFRVKDKIKVGTRWIVCKTDGTFNTFHVPESGYIRFREPIVEYNESARFSQNIGFRKISEQAIIEYDTSNGFVDITKQPGGGESVCTPEWRPAYDPNRGFVSGVVQTSEGAPPLAGESGTTNALPTTYTVVTFNREFGWIGSQEVEAFDGAVTNVSPLMRHSVVDVDVRRVFSAQNSDTQFVTRVGPGGLLTNNDAIAEVIVGWYGLSETAQSYSLPSEMGNLWGWLIRNDTSYGLKRVRIESGAHYEIFDQKLNPGSYAFFVQAGDHPVFGNWQESYWNGSVVNRENRKQIGGGSYLANPDATISQKGLIQQGQFQDRIWDQSLTGEHFPYSVSLDSYVSQKVFRPVLHPAFRMNFADRQRDEANYRSTLAARDENIVNSDKKLLPKYLALVTSVEEYLDNATKTLEDDVESYRRKYSQRSCFTEREAELYFPRPTTPYTYHDVVAGSLPPQIQRGLVPICRAASTWVVRDIASLRTYAVGVTDGVQECPVGYPEVGNSSFCGRLLEGDDAYLSENDDHVVVHWNQSESLFSQDLNDIYAGLATSRTYEMRLSNCDESYGESCMYEVNIELNSQEIILSIDGNAFSKLTGADYQFIDLVLSSDIMNPTWVFEVRQLNDACNDCSGDPGAPWPTHATTLRPDAFVSGVPRPQGAAASLRFVEEDVSLGGPQNFGLRRVIENANANVSGLFGGGQASIFEKKVEISNVLGNARIFDGSQITVAGRTSSVEIDQTATPQEVQDEVTARGLENEPLSWNMVEYGLDENGEYTNPNFRAQARAYIVTYGGKIVAQRTEIMYPSGYLEIYGSDGWLAGQRDVNKNGFDISYGEWDLVDMFNGSTVYRPLPQQYVEVLAGTQTSRCMTFVLDANIGNLVTEVQNCNEDSLTTYSYVNGVMTQADRQDGVATYAWSQVGTTPLLTNAGGLSNLARKGDAVISYDPVEATRVNNISYGSAGVAVERDAAGIKYTGPTGYSETHLHSAHSAPQLEGSEFAGGIVGGGIGDALSNTITRDPITQQPTQTETGTQVVGNTYDLQSRLPESTVITEDSKDTTVQRGYDGTKVNSLSVQSGATSFSQTIDYQQAGHELWGSFAANPQNITMNKEGETFTVSQSFNATGLPESIKYEGTTADDTFVYNPSGCLTSVNGVSLVVDERCNPTTITDRNNNVSSAGYDLAGRLETSLDAAGGTVALAYGDTIGLPEYGLLDSVTDRGIATAYAYTNNRQIDTISVGGQQVVGYLYDSVGNVQKITDGDGVVREMIRGAEGHVDSSCVGSSNAECYNYTYDAQGRLLTVEDPNNKTTTFTPGHLGRVANVVAADTGSIGYEYDELGNLTKLTDPNNKVTTYRYGPVGELLEEVRPGSRSTAYVYDGKRRLTQQTSPNGSTMTYVYDVGNNTIDEVSSIAYSDGRTVTYGRDANGNILSEVDSAVFGAGNVYSATYDPLDRVNVLNVPYANLSFDYDYHVNTHGGNLDRLLLSGAASAIQTYSYDGQGRLTGITDTEAGNLTWVLSAAGRVSSLALPGSGSYTYTYDTEGKGRLVDIAGANLDLEYVYDAAGNVTTRKIAGVAESFTYDNVNRLLTSGSETFVYDQAGNRTESNSETWAYSDRNELDSQGAISHTYDNNGNLTQTNYVGGAIATYTWNAADQMTSFQYVDSGSIALTTATYIYDSSGRRVQKDLDGTITKYVWEGPRMMAELDGTNTIQRRYVYRGFTPLAMVEYGAGGTSTPFYYLTDAIGTPHKLVNAAGAVVWSADYKVFGEATVTTGIVEQNLRFPGQYYDSESGLHYNYKRYYDPGMGRYISVDPVDSSDPYVYVGNNPLIHTDAYGLLSAEKTKKIIDILKDANDLDTAIGKITDEIGPAEFVLGIGTDRLATAGLCGLAVATGAAASSPWTLVLATLAGFGVGEAFGGIGGEVDELLLLKLKEAALKKDLEMKLLELDSSLTVLRDDMQKLKKLANRTERDYLRQLRNRRFDSPPNLPEDVLRKIEALK